MCDQDPNTTSASFVTRPLWHFDMNESVKSSFLSLLAAAAAAEMVKAGQSFFDLSASFSQKEVLQSFLSALWPSGLCSAENGGISFFFKIATLVLGHEVKLSDL